MPSLRLLTSHAATLAASLGALAALACTDVNADGLFAEPNAVLPAPSASLDASIDDGKSMAPLQGLDAGARSDASDARAADAARPHALPPLIVGVTSDDDDSACTLPSDATRGAIVFSGSAVLEACPINLDSPYGTFWYAYADGNPSSDVSAQVRAPGCNDAVPCALWARAPLTDAGTTASSMAVGFPVSVGGITRDLSAFSGMRFWARGTISGSRGPGDSESPQTLLVQLVTSTDRAGDDFGAYCRIDAERWTECSVAFSELGREGTAGAPDVAGDRLELERVRRIEFAFAAAKVEAGTAALAFDVRLAAISFF
jgi:hypothetical protein